MVTMFGHRFDSGRLHQSWLNKPNKKRQPNHHWARFFALGYFLFHLDVKGVKIVLVRY